MFYIQYYLKRSQHHLYIAETEAQSVASHKDGYANTIGLTPSPLGP